jgi:hypothetical protein
MGVEDPKAISFIPLFSWVLGLIIILSLIEQCYLLIHPDDLPEVLRTTSGFFSRYQRWGIVLCLHIHDFLSELNIILLV